MDSEACDKPLLVPAPASVPVSDAPNTGAVPSPAGIVARPSVSARREMRVESMGRSSPVLIVVAVLWRLRSFLRRRQWLESPGVGASPVRTPGDHHVRG